VIDRDRALMLSRVHRPAAVAIEQQVMGKRPVNTVASASSN